MLRAVLGTIMTSVGDVAVCKVQNPYLGARAWEFAYAAVVVDKARKYDGPEVAMIVTVLDERYAVAEDLWRPFERTVKNVYAVKEFRVRATPDARPTVQVGRFLHVRGAFVRHSSSRSTAGDAWATATGGFLPENTEYFDADGPYSEESKNALCKLQTDLWWQPLVHDHALIEQVEPDITQ